MTTGIAHRVVSTHSFDTHLAQALAAGRYAMRRWEVNVERADECHRVAEVAAHTGQYHAAADALRRQRVYADLAGDFKHRYHRQLRLVHALTKPDDRASRRTAPLSPACGRSQASPAAD
jgi:hypothetical protein